MCYYIVIVVHHKGFVKLLSSFRSRNTEQAKSLSTPPSSVGQGAKGLSCYSFSHGPLVSIKFCCVNGFCFGNVTS